MAMDIEKLIKLVLSNPLNIDIKYSNINGKEKLTVNGKEIKEEFDDTEIKNKIKTYKENVAKIDDYLFNDIIDKTEEYDLSKMNSVLELDSYTEEQAANAENVICIMSSLIKETLCNKINELKDLFNKF